VCFSKKNELTSIDYREIGAAEVRFQPGRGLLTNPDAPLRFGDDISFDELESRADLVVRVRAVGSRGKNNCALTRVEVLRVLRGEGVAAGAEIEVYEWGQLFLHRVYLAFDGYVLMQPGREYILFLEKFDNPYSGEEAYLLVNVFYGKIATEWNDTWDVVDPEAVKTMTYAQVQDFGVITDDREVIERYREIYENAMRMDAEG
jgi:hypothetical protein